MSARPSPLVATYRRDEGPSRTLAVADPLLGRLIDQVGEFTLGPVDSRFEVLLRSIVSQQLAEAAAEKIWARVETAVELTPEAVASADHDALFAAGLSHRKVEYMQGIAAGVLANDPDLEALDDLDDDAVRDALVHLRGVGRWTADMFLIFALHREDILPIGDFGLRASTGRMLGLGRPATVEEVEERGDLWRPYRSVATVYLWRSSGLVPAVG
jgi:DNA-3-methyladenine glycosylase II